MDNLKEICIICEDMVLAGSSRQPTFDRTALEDELRDSRLFLCKVLSIPISCFEYIGFPFCQKCTTTKVKELMEVHNQLLALQISYASLKDNFLRDIVTVYVRKKSGSFNSEDKGITDIIIKNWKDYIADSGCLLPEDNEIFKSEFVDFSEPDIKEEFCERSSTGEIDSTELDPLSPDTSQIFTDYTDDNALDFEDARNNSVLKIPRQRKCRRTKLNYREIAETMSRREDDNENISKRKSRKCTKRKATSSKAKDCNVKVKPVKNNQRCFRKAHQCPHCPRKVRGTDSLRDHIRTHTNERPHVCSECNQAFRQHAHLTAHKRLRHGYQGKRKTIEGLNEIVSKDRTYHCIFCDTASKRKGFYIRHLMHRHMGAEIQEGESVWFYYCDAKECLVACASQDRLKNHFKESHKDLLSEACSEFPECDICQRVFTLQENLEIHRSSHPPENNEDEITKFSCDYCYEVFNSQAEKDEHLPRHEVPCGSSKIFCHLCDLCGRSYSDSSALIYHKRKVHSQNKDNPKSQKSRIYFCGLCNDQLESKRTFVHHLKSLHSQEINPEDTIWFYHCDVHECLASYTNQDGLKKHFEDNHKSLLDIDCSDFPQCDICQRVFVQKNNLDVHRRSHNSDSHLMFGCDYCYTNFLSETALIKHHSEHKVQFDLPESHHSCEFCGDEFSKEYILKQHLKTVHSKSKTGKCPVCEKVLAVGTIPLHIMKHKNPEGLSCSHCPHVASTSTNLQLHMEKIHPSACKSTKLLSHSCRYCEKRFYLPTEVHRHSITYHPEEYLNGKSFCCSCYSTFQTEEEMNVHFKSQHPHLICSVEGCGKKFLNPTRISLHMNTHNKVKPFICEYCQRGFAQDASLQFHINTKHTFHRSFLCKLCPDNPGFYERRTFNKHLESEHPTCAVKDILITDYPKRKYFF